MPSISLTVATRWRLEARTLPVLRLTKRAVDSLKPAARRFIAYDSELKGFGLKVAPSGSKSWCVEYRGGARGRSVGKRRMVLGSATTLTPEEARNAARGILARAALGEDPAATRIRAREIPSFNEFAERYLIEEAEAKLKPRSVVNYRIYLRKHASPLLGSKKLDKVRGLAHALMVIDPKSRKLIKVELQKAQSILPDTGKLWAGWPSALVKVGLGKELGAIAPADVAALHRQIGLTKPMTANHLHLCAELKLQFYDFNAVAHKRYLANCPRDTSKDIRFSKKLLQLSAISALVFENRKDSGPDPFIAVSLSACLDRSISQRE